MKKIINWLADNWLPLITYSMVAAICLGLLWFRLGTLVPGLHEQELSQIQRSSSLRTIIENPLNMPHKILQYIPQYFGTTSDASIRFASTIVGLTIIISFYYILRNWYTTRIAVLGSVLFITSAWFLNTSRSGTDSIMLALPILAVACAIWLRLSRASMPAISISLLVCLALLYTPGMIWFIVPVIVWQHKQIVTFLRSQRKPLLAFMTLAVLVFMVPLVLSFIKQPELLKTYLGLGQNLPTVSEYAKNAINAHVEIYALGPDTPGLWLNQLPLVDWLTGVMFAIGIYAYFFKRQLDRTILITYIGIAGTLLVGLGGSVNSVIFMPFVYLVASGGIALMLQQWFTVFPRNPFARGFGALLLSAAVLSAVYYNLNHYFVAWPNAPETRQIHRHKLS